MLLTGDTAEETLYNLGCALQVLSDATTQQGHSDELTRGWWLLLQTLADAALTESRQNHQDSVTTVGGSFLPVP